MRAVPIAGTRASSRRSGTRAADRAPEFRRNGRAFASLVAVAGTSLLVGCLPKPVDPVPVPAAPAPFIRAPYVQNVGIDHASIIWMTGETKIDSLLYRPAGTSGPWREAPISERGRGVVLARLDALPANSDIEYEAWSRETRSGPWTFRTAPEPGVEDTLRVLLFGDSGWGSDAQIELARRMERMDWDLAIHVGDIAYYDGTETDFTDRHFRVYRRMLARIPFYPSVGNHDVRTDGGAAYDRAFVWPEEVEGARFYSFRWNAVQFLALDTSSGTADVEELRQGRGRQYEWLSRSLEAAQADPGVEWIVVFGHHPPYSHAVGISGHGQEYALRKVLPPLFDRYGVDLMAAGHDHHYERSVPIRNGRPVPDGCGPVYVVQGAGGASREARDVTSSPFTAFKSREFSFTELTFAGDRLHGRTIGVDGATLDDFVVLPNPGSDSSACED